MFLYLFIRFDESTDYAEAGKAQVLERPRLKNKAFLLTILKSGRSRAQFPIKTDKWDQSDETFMRQALLS
jgi:hypothetical protein